MEDIIRSLYYMVEDWIGQHDLLDEEAPGLEGRQEAVHEEIIRRLGEDGQELLEALADLNLRLETIHDEALFRAALGLGTQLAQPGVRQAKPVRPYSTSL